MPSRLREHIGLQRLGRPRLSRLRLDRLRPPRRTVRLRLTVLYTALFLASGCGLIAATYLLAVHQGVIGHFDTTSPPPVPVIGGKQGIAPAVPGRGWLYLPTAATLAGFFAESWILLVILGILSAALGWLVAGRVLRPLRTMTAVAREISDQNLSVRLALPGPRDELKDLGDTIDGLLARLEAAFDAQRRFVANASHELRTPLAMMRTSLDVAIGKPGHVPPEVAVLAAKLGEGLDRAGQLLESLLMLARAGSGAIADRAAVPLCRLARDALDAHRPALTEKGLAVQATFDSGTAVIGNEMLLARLVDNIIDNAVRHNEPRGWILVVTENHGGVARLAVESGGQVLDEGKVAQLGQPFLRLGADRTGSTDSTGLGLSIVAAITAAHHGTLRLHALPEGGLRVVVELPRAMQPDAAGAPA